MIMIMLNAYRELVRKCIGIIRHITKFPILIVHVNFKNMHLVTVELHHHKLSIYTLKS